jgi:2-deoxy-D-gluconate 3-dehydrogenase
MSGLFDLEGATAVVTGVSRGIGYAIARALAEAGADIIGVSTSVEAQKDAATAVQAAGRRYEARAVDLAVRAEVVSLGDELSARRIEMLFCNAGMIDRAPAAEYPLESWDRVLAVNLDSAFILSQAVGRSMLRRGQGRIVFTASLLSFQGGITVPAYAASKSAIAGLTRALANEWTSSGVTVNAIVPGYIATDNTSALRADPERAAAILARIPAARWGTPDDLGGTAVYLASAASSYVSGALIPVDGGWLAR